MDESEFTVEQAADPATPAQVLADIAALRADLRPAVARNPAAYPGLLEWLGSLGEPAVDAALAERREAEAAASAQATQVLPMTPPAQPGVPPAPSWAGAEPSVPAAPYGGEPTQSWQAEPAPQWQGQAQQPYGAPVGAPYGAPPAGMPPAGMPPKKRSLAWLWILLGVIGLIIVGVIVAVVVFINRAADTFDDIVETLPAVDTDAGYGDDPALDALWDACAAEDWQACDDLYSQAPFGSEYESFGDTCGNRTEGASFCVEEFATDGGTDTGASTYGDDAALDALWDACAAEDWQACDDLYAQAPIGSDYETFGDTCGNRTDGASFCTDAMADGTTTGGGTYGSDPALDALYDSCAAGDDVACDTLFEESPIGSEYEAFGDTCGGRQEAGTNLWCDPARN